MATTPRTLPMDCAKRPRGALGRAIALPLLLISRPLDPLQCFGGNLPNMFNPVLKGTGQIAHSFYGSWPDGAQGTRSSCPNFIAGVMERSCKAGDRLYA